MPLSNLLTHRLGDRQAGTAVSFRQSKSTHIPVSTLEIRTDGGTHSEGHSPGKRAGNALECGRTSYHGLPEQRTPSFATKTLLEAHLLTRLHAQTSFKLDTIPLLHFILFAALNTPPNYLWQTWLEAQFPAYTTSLSGAEKEKVMDDKVTGTHQASDTSRFATTTHPTKSKKSLNIRNTASKFLLDQTFGAAVNTVLFIAVLALFRGESWGGVAEEVKSKFWPMIFAGQKLWPMVSVLSFTVVPVQYRMLFGSVIGVFWGIFLSLTARKGKLD
nr:protein sym1 [Quercus suber]